MVTSLPRSRSAGLVFAVCCCERQVLGAFHREKRQTEEKENTYHVALAFEEGADRVVQLLYGNRHAAAEIGDFALTRWPSPRLVGMKGWDPRKRGRAGGVVN